MGDGCLTVAEAITGGCLCGACRYEAHGEPVDVRVCHCRNCQKVTGAALYARVRMPGAAVTISGPVGWYSSSDIVLRGFCPTCGASLFAKRTDGSTISLLMGSLDEPDRFAPTAQIWMSSKQAWVDLGGDLPGYADGPPA
jgi:hypothetical protein